MKRAKEAAELRKLDPQPPRCCTLDELLAQCDPKAPCAKRDREWLDSKPLGGELI